MISEHTVCIRVALAGAIMFFLLSCKKTPATSGAVTYTECQSLIFDLSDGTMNGVKPNLYPSEIKEWLPCYSRFTPNGGEKDCGGGLIYDPYHFSYYTYLNKYITVDKRFKGKVTDSLFLKDRVYIRKMLGAPDQTNAIKADTIDLFPADYGCIRVHYNKSTGKTADSLKTQYPLIIATHYCDCGTVEWCQEEHVK